jgi:hypothetical protein
MTIALKIELREDWNNNAPAVRVMAKTLRHPPLEVARLTPQNPVADVCITKEQDLYFELEDYSVGEIENAANKDIYYWRALYKTVCDERDEAIEKLRTAEPKAGA